MTDYTPVSPETLTTFLAEFPNWKVVDGKLLAHFTFHDFREAFSFMTVIALETEVQGHHPTWSNTYNHVDFSLSTHDADDSITEKDLALVKYITGTVQWFTR